MKKIIYNKFILPDLQKLKFFILLYRIRLPKYQIKKLNKNQIWEINNANQS